MESGGKKWKANVVLESVDVTSATLYLTHFLHVGSVGTGQVTGQGLRMGTSMPCSGHAIGRTIRVRYLKLWLQTGWICFPMGGSFSPSITLYRIRMQQKAGEWRDIAELGSAALVPVPTDVHPLCRPAEGLRIIPFGNTLFPFQNVKSRGGYLKWLKSPTSGRFFKCFLLDPIQSPPPHFLNQPLRFRLLLNAFSLICFRG